MTTHPELAHRLAIEVRNQLTAEAEHARLLKQARLARRARRVHRRSSRSASPTQAGWTR